MSPWLVIPQYGHALNHVKAAWQFLPGVLAWEEFLYMQQVEGHNTACTNSIILQVYGRASETHEWHIIFKLGKWKTVCIDAIPLVLLSRKYIPFRNSIAALLVTFCPSILVLITLYIDIISLEIAHEVIGGASILLLPSNFLPAAVPICM
jgi:hypothetical protein